MSGITRKVRQLVLERDGHKCVICRRSIVARLYSLHHRRPRGMGGSSDPVTNGPANLITLCGSGVSGCHGRVEASPEEARLHGWRVRQDSDPALAPVEWFGCTVRLTDEGGVDRGG